VAQDAGVSLDLLPLPQPSQPDVTRLNKSVWKQNSAGQTSAYYLSQGAKPKEDYMVPERRQFARLTPRSPLFVHLDESKRGLVLDVGEGGLAVASLVPKSPDEIISLVLDLPEADVHIQTKAQIAWTRDSGHLSGARFLDLDDSSRQQLEQWVSIRADDARGLAAGTVPAEPAQPAFAADTADASAISVAQVQKDSIEAGSRFSLISLQLTGESNTKDKLEGNENSSEGASRYPLKLFLAVMLLSWALVFLGYRMGIMDVSPHVTQVTASTKPSAAPSKSSIDPVDRSSLATSLLPNGVSWNDPGVVLQVAAMAEESNADALAEILQKRNFPAFVFKRGGDRFYKVAVGPYNGADADSTAKVKTDLEKQGLTPILKPWLPE
jgi:septal ring-binding cell division protein DamX